MQNLTYFKSCILKFVCPVIFRMDFNGMYTEQINMDDTILYT